MPLQFYVLAMVSGVLGLGAMVAGPAIMFLLTDSSSKTADRRKGIAGGLAVAAGLVVAGVLFHMARGPANVVTEPFLGFGTRAALAAGGGAGVGALMCGSVIVVGTAKQKSEMLMATLMLGVFAAVMLWRGFQG